MLTAVSPAVTATRRPADISFDKLQSARGTIKSHGCFLVPTPHGWPHLILKVDQGFPVVVHFLAGDWDQRPPVSQSLARDRPAVLSEPARLELCRHLIGEPITTSNSPHARESANRRCHGT